ncbi:NUMOD4 motif-containing HNH endonuclease [Mycolicibacterium austroafricanum]|nr:NUMOD4 motif-containing HNH endonuclease [Mycolicibacterium austroafricanum]
MIDSRLVAVEGVTPEEEWRPVVDWEDCYEVSNQGRVRSLDRWVANRSSTGRSLMKGRVLAGSIDKIGRPYVRLSRQQVAHRKTVSRLVLEAFVGPCPEGMEGCHNDGNPANNWIGNLRWDTRTNNIYDAVRHGTHQQASKTHCKQGHEYTPENTSYRRGGRGRICKECVRIRTRDHWRKNHGKNLYYRSVP